MNLDHWILHHVEPVKSDDLEYRFHFQLEAKEDHLDGFDDEMAEDLLKPHWSCYTLRVSVWAAGFCLSEEYLGGCFAKDIRSDIYDGAAGYLEGMKLTAMANAKESFLSIVEAFL